MKKGFTFVELLVALSLFSVGMISVLQIFPVNRRLISQASMQTQATYLAQEQMETLRSLPYASLTVGTYEPKAIVPNSSGTTLSLFQRSTTIEYIDSSYAVSATDTGLKRETVTVYWNDGALARTYVLVTYDYDK
jgi:prepilin-type N-terminal cleavage/methylation domain-containing protein